MGTMRARDKGRQEVERERQRGGARMKTGRKAVGREKPTRRDKDEKRDGGRETECVVCGGEILSKLLF